MAGLRAQSNTLYRRDDSGAFVPRDEPLLTGVVEDLERLVAELIDSNSFVINISHQEMFKPTYYLNIYFKPHYTMTSSD